LFSLLSNLLGRRRFVAAFVEAFGWLRARDGLVAANGLVGALRASI
jgi:hypothetical protein